MRRIMILGLATMGAWLGWASVSEAQVFIRAPFVRVAVGDGVWVRAPFVNIMVPGDGPRIVYPPAPQMPPPGEALPLPKPQGEFPPPPVPAQAPAVPTHDAFAKNFQAKAGTYEVTMINPITKQPNTVRFVLPEGTPRRVNVSRDSVEFVYGLRQWVRIEFDRDGALVTSR